MAGNADISEIQRLREKAGLSRVELAERAGIPLRSIYYYEREGRRPTRGTRLLLAAALLKDDPALAGEAVEDRRGDRRHGQE